MRKWWDRLKRAGSVLCAAVSVYIVVAACGPQNVPLPSSRGGYTRGGTGTTPPPSPAAGQAVGQAGQPVQPAAGSGTTIPPIPRSGSVAPPPRAGNTATGGRMSTTPPPVAGSEGPATLPPFDAGNDPNRNRVMPGRLCARLAEIECAAEQHCCNNPGRAVASCVSDLTRACGESLYLDQVANNRTSGWDQEATVTAYTELEKRASECDLSIPEWILSAQGVRSILRGTIAPGASCKPAGGLTDKAAQAAALMSCTGVGTTACLPRSLLGDWTCVGKNGSGGACVTEENCQAGLYCNNPQMMLNGRCAARKALGDSCMVGTDCASFYCKSGRCVEPDAQVAFCLNE